MVEGVAVPKAPLVTRMMELKKQQARAPLPVRARTQTGKKQNPSAKRLLDQKLAIKEGLPLTAYG